MTKGIPRLAAAVMLVPILLTGPARATSSVKTFVTGTGNDGFSCADVANACKTLAVALSKTQSGGEITVVNAGDYGTVNIDRSVSISNDSAGEASILAPSTTGVLIGAGQGDVVSLRGLVIDGLGSGAGGILFSTASALHVQNCVIRNFESSQFAAQGINFQPSAAAKLFVSDTIIYNNGFSQFSGGLFLEPSGPGSFDVVLERVHLENNVFGIVADASSLTGAGLHVTLRDSVVSGNASTGVWVRQGNNAAAVLFSDHTSSVNNGGEGFFALGPHAIVLLNDTTVTRNSMGLRVHPAGGQFISYGNNRINNNIGADGAPTALNAKF